MVEVGETLEQAIRREALEETGLTLGPVRQFEVFERIMRDSEGRAEYHYVLVDFVCDTASGEACAATDASRCAWTSQHDLASYCLTEGTLAVIERAFQARAK